MRRRDFIKVVAGSTIALPLTARAQQALAQTRHVGMLVGISRDDPDGQLRYAAFLEVLRQLGWVEGQNVRVDARYAGGDANLTRQYAAELIALAPDVIVTVGTASAETLLQSTSTVPVVFTIVLDPVGAGLVKNSIATRRQCDWLHAVRI